MDKTAKNINKKRREAEASPMALLLTLGMAAERGDLAGAAGAQQALRDRHGIIVKMPLSLQMPAKVGDDAR